MSPTLLYILNVIKVDMAVNPNAYSPITEDPLTYFRSDGRRTRAVLSSEPIPWSY